MINLDTVLSEFDDRGTLLKYLNKVGAALNNASLKTVEVNQVSTTQVKLKFIFADDSYVESPVLTMPQGAQGVQGPQGPRGERGEQGLPGINGENGRDGKDGKDGKSFNIIGSVTSTSQLPQTAPAGTAYFVGASAPRDVYVFATGTNAWVNQGKLQGPRGEAGPQGVSIQRIDFQSDYTMKVTLSNGTTYVSQSLRGPKGEPGASGSVDANKLHELIVGSQHIVADLNSGGDKIEIRLDNAILESITNAISDISKLKTGKQDNLVSGTNIKSINGTSLLGSGDIIIESGGGASGVQLSSPSTATNGTITQGQLTTLQESDLNYIIFNNEIYSLNDKTHTADTLTYSHVGFENGKHLLKTISITVSTRAWVLNTTIVNQGGTTPTPSDELIGTWVFKFENGSDATQIASDFTFDISFISNDVNYSSLRLQNYKGRAVYVYYDSTLSCDDGSGWQNLAYKTIKITDVSNLTNRVEFETWLKANATKQGNGGSGGGTTGKEFGYTLNTNSYFSNSFLVFGGETTFMNTQNEPENWYGWHEIKTGGGTTKKALMFIMIGTYTNSVDNGVIYDANGTFVNNSSLTPLRPNVLYLLGSDATIWSRD